MLDTKLFTKVIIFTIDTYIARMRSEGLELPKLLIDLRSSIIAFKPANVFTEAEAKQVLKYGKDPELLEIIHTEISHVIFILTVIKLWAELIPKKDRPLLNISDKRLIKGKAEYAMYMLKLKQSNKETYEEKRDIIDTSVKTAEAFMEYHIRKLIIKDTI